MSFYIYLIIIAVLAAVLLLVLLTKRHVVKNLNLVTLLVSLPQKESTDDMAFLRDIALSEQLLSALSAIPEPITLEMAVHSSGEQIYFYLAVPRSHKEFASRQIQGFFPEANIKQSTDYTIFADNPFNAGVYLKTDQPDMVPIRTYKESEADSFSALVSTFSRLHTEGEGASLQLVLRPAKPNFLAKTKSIINKLKQGEKWKSLTGGNNSLDVASDLVTSFIGEKKEVARDNLPKEIDDDKVTALEKKISKPLFEANIRIVAAADSTQKAEDIILSASGAFAQFSAPNRNSFKVITPKKNKKLIAEYIFRDFNQGASIVLNTEELASIFHLPTTSTNVPRIKWQKTKDAPPPQDLPTTGTLIGESVFRGDVRPIFLTADDRRRHFYIIGQTGTGKSYFMLNKIVQDMKHGEGVCVVDPHGELVDDVLERVPSNRVEDVIVFNSGDVMRPLGLNMLEYDLTRPEEKTFIVNEIQSIFNRLFSEESMGPIFEQYMRNALLLLMEDAKYEPATLMEVPRIFTDEAFREKKLARITNPAVIDFWQKEANKTTGEQGLANIAPYITSKFGNFIANDYMRPIIGQTTSSFNFREVMDTRKILLVNLAKGKIGDINSGLLGMIITGRLLLAALARADMKTEDRPDFYLYIDEFQNFTTDSISVILSEARKYRLNLILAHQYISQLTDTIRESVFGNVGSMAAFRVGTTDTETLLKQYSPVFDANDLVNIENKHAHTKLLLNGEPAKPFSLRTTQVAGGAFDLKDELKELSRLTYGRDIAEVEQDILRRLRQ